MENSNQDWSWCLTGNIIQSHEYGECHEIRTGTKHFSPGTKVYMAPVSWGDGYERIHVIGKPRHGSPFIDVIMQSKYIENCRLQKVFSPTILKMMAASSVSWWSNSDEDRDRIIQHLKWLNPSEALKELKKFASLDGFQASALHTPCGDIRILDSNLRPIPFRIDNNLFDCDYGIYDDSNQNVVDTIVSDNNFTLSIDASSLELGKSYYIKFDGGELHIGAGDEHTVSLLGSFHGYSIGIGAYDPNDDEKMEQAWSYSKEKGYLNERIIQEPPQYDETGFVKYTTDVMDDYTGFTFKVFDRSFDKAHFDVAWLKHTLYDADTCEDAIDFWIT